MQGKHLGCKDLLAKQETPGYATPLPYLYDLHIKPESRNQPAKVSPRPLCMKAAASSVQKASQAFANSSETFLA